jgi:CheY-like chemotaxis protein
MTKILLVEDDKSLREIYGVRLLAEGYDIVSAGDGEEALAMAIKERPQLIVSDVMMPKISGFDMLDILRSTTETKDIRVIMMTALSSEDQRARGEALGADRYLVKSQVGIEDVVRTVHDVLGDAPVTAPSPGQAFGGSSPSSFGPRQAAPLAPRPVADTPQAPVAPPSTQPVARPPLAPTPSFQAAASAPAGLPQPTAPFSTARPANLGERVIHPITPQQTTEPDLGSRIDQELHQAIPPISTQQPATPIQVLSGSMAPTPVTPLPTTQATPVREDSGISFEETPYVAATPPVSNQFTPGPQPPASQ